MDTVRVLIVDDEELICQSIMSKIGRLKHERAYSVSYATNAADALALYDGAPFDIVITDINMPGIDGFAFVSKLRERSRDVLIFIVSGYDHFDYVRKAFLLTVNDYLLKPVAIAELDEKLRLARVAPRRAEPSVSRLVEAVLARACADDRYRITLKEIAAELHVGYSHLSSLFSDQMGCGYSAYMIKKRMERAKLLLDEPNLRVSDVAEMLGYDEPNLFSRDYKRYFGESPKNRQKQRG